MAKKNRKRTVMAALLVTALILLVTASNAMAGGALNPQPPDYMIRIIPGIPLVFDLEDKLPAETESVRFDIDGEPFVTDDFAPFGDFIPTKFIDRRGISFDTVHDFNIVATPIFGEGVTVAEYHLVVHRMPVVPPFRPLPLVRENRRKLIGFQLRGVSGHSKVRMWGRGFQQLRGRQQLRLRLVGVGENGRTYAIPGGLTWRGGAVPHVIISVHPGYEIKYGAFVLGRLYTGVLRTRRDGDTNIHRIGNSDWCTDEISRNHKPPRRQNCDHF